MFILHFGQFKPKSCLKLINKYIFSEGEQFPLKEIYIIGKVRLLSLNWRPLPNYNV